MSTISSRRAFPFIFIQHFAPSAIMILSFNTLLRPPSWSCLSIISSQIRWSFIFCVVVRGILLPMELETITRLSLFNCHNLRHFYSLLQMISINVYLTIIFVSVCVHVLFFCMFVLAYRSFVNGVTSHYFSIISITIIIWNIFLMFKGLSPHQFTEKVITNINTNVAFLLEGCTVTAGTVGNGDDTGGYGREWGWYWRVRSGMGMILAGTVGVVTIFIPVQPSNFYCADYAYSDQWHIT